MMSRRQLSAEEKAALIQRMKSGISVSALARETGILRKSLYAWLAAYLAMGEAGLNRKRGPKPGGRASGGPAAAAGPPDARPPDDLERAKTRIAELERVIGRQQVALDFFQQALRSWDAKRRKGAATISSDSSDK
jgi:transposase-like protein